MKKVTQFASPFSTGGGGVRFEWLVGTSYLVSLLRGECARGLPGMSTVVEVRPQQALKGYPVDDVVIVATQGTKLIKLSLQVKHTLALTENPLFCKVMGACWEHFSGPTFKQDKDFVGIAIGEQSNIKKIRSDLQDILEWARTHETSRSFLSQVKKFKNKNKLLDEIHKALNAGVKKHVTKDQAWSLLRRFVVIPFDFDSTGSRDSTDCWNALRTIVDKRKPEQAKAVFDGLYGLISRYSQSGGEIDYEAIYADLQEHMPITFRPHLGSVMAILNHHVTNQLCKEKNSKKYIPDVFAEVSSVKDFARYFSHPLLFIQKPIDKLMAVDTSFLNHLRSMLGLQGVSLKPKKGFNVPTKLSQLPSQLESLSKHLDALATELRSDYYDKIFENNKECIPEGKGYIFNNAKHLLRNPGCCALRAVEDISKDVSAMKARVFLLTSRAGQGKTNFVCDFTENFLLLHRIPCLFLTGREFRIVSINQLSFYIATLISRGESENIDDALKSVGDKCEEVDKPFVVILDGINEHHDIINFANELEKIIERLLEHSFVKVIVTCRSEYFEERFSNLLTASFGGSVFQAREIHNKMSNRHQQRMVAGYFWFFRIQQSYLSNKIRQTLSEDPLLLRFFCEAYGDPEAKRIIVLPQMADIYREEIFNKYFEKKLAEVSTRNSEKTGVGIPQSHPYKSVLSEIIAAMISKKQFSDIPISSLDVTQQRFLADLIAEDLFVRKDLVVGKSVLDLDAEVINFTFDEFRDYLVADHLINEVFDKRSQHVFNTMLDGFTSEECTISEGIERYVFYTAKKPGRETLLAAITEKNWFETVFLGCIFSVKEECITDSDVKMIIEKFSQSNENARQIFFALMHRCDTNAFPTLNIDVLFRILDDLQESSFEKLVVPIFFNRESRHTHSQHDAPYQIERFIGDIRFLSKNQTDRENICFAKYIELLVYLFGIEGRDYDYPALTLFKELATQDHDKVMEILSAHTKVESMQIRRKIWELLTELVAHEAEPRKALVEEAVEGLSNQKDSPFCSHNENLQFLIAVDEKFGSAFTDKVTSSASTQSFGDV